MSRTFLRVCVVVASTLQVSFALIPLLNLPAEGREPGVLLLWGTFFLMVGGLGIITQARPALWGAVIIANAICVVLTLPQNIMSILDRSWWRAMTMKELLSIWFALVWGATGLVNVIALTLLKRQDARGKPKEPPLERDWDAT